MVRPAGRERRGEELPLRTISVSGGSLMLSRLSLGWKLMSCSHVKSGVNLLTWLLIGCSSSCAANQELACLLTQFLTMTTTHKFPSLDGGPRLAHDAQRCALAPVLRPSLNT